MHYFDLMVAPNGARLIKSDHPAVPLSPRELAVCAQDCWQAGANWFHLHVRDQIGRHSLDPDLYRQAIAEIRKLAPDIKIQITTEAAGIFDVSEQVSCLRDLRPSAASISVREIAGDPHRQVEAYEIVGKNGTLVQHILYSTADVSLLLQAFGDGTIPETMRDVIFVLGRHTDGQVSHPDDLDPFLNALSGHNLRWSVCAFGQHEQACLLYAIQSGGNARIGFENNTVSPEGTPYPDNAASVAGLVAAAKAVGFAPAKEQL